MTHSPAATHEPATQSPATQSPATQSPATNQNSLATGPVLTAEMVREIESLFPRYPSRQAVTLPALHIVNEKLRHVPLQAVVEIARLLGLAPSQVQDTLSF